MGKCNRYLCVLIVLIQIGSNTWSQTTVETKVDSTNHDSCFCITITTSVFNNFRKLTDQLSTVKCYYKDGKIKEEYSKMIGGKIVGVYQSYYANGQLKVQFNSIYGRRVGLYLEYFPSGIKKTVGYYANVSSLADIKKKCDTTYIEMSLGKAPLVTCEIESVKIGEWLYYNDAGEIIKREHY